MTYNGVSVPSKGPFADFGFSCPVAVMGESKDYNRSQYQYATTSRPPAEMSPGAIIYPQGKTADGEPQDAECLENIKRAFAYTAQHGKCVAVRTGGHAYNGTSSCASDNIQLDMSEAFLNWEKPYWGKEDWDS